MRRRRGAPTLPPGCMGSARALSQGARTSCHGLQRFLMPVDLLWVREDTCTRFVKPEVDVLRENCNMRADVLSMTGPASAQGGGLGGNTSMALKGGAFSARLAFGAVMSQRQCCTTLCPHTDNPPQPQALPSILQPASLLTQQPRPNGRWPSKCRWGAPCLIEKGCSGGGPRAEESSQSNWAPKASTAFTGPERGSLWGHLLMPQHIPLRRVDV